MRAAGRVELTFINRMKASEIRSTFFEFFRKKGHEIVASAPMVLKDDPTLMFTNAGMNQFKDIFLGNTEAKNTRVANTQKCLRVSGKHNDLEEVGVDTYHHTMFEMLGNWSFGDYFKKEAIEWAWELLVDELKIDKDRLYFTVFKGDEQDGTEEDKESYMLWQEILAANGLEEERILLCDKKDNFWEMGDTGPCGPSSEIHVDLRDDDERAKTDGRDLVNMDHPQVIEIWNLVFIESNRMANGSLNTLPAKHVDTGMGLERLAMVLQGKKSNYDTDIFTPLIGRLEQISGMEYGYSDTSADIAMRVIADHVRAVSFAIADGQLPSNTGAGYVIRRILRRAIRYGYSFLNRKDPFIHELVKILVDEMHETFPEIKSQQDIITKVIHEEEESFLRTLEKGVSRFQNYISEAVAEKVIDGKFAFELYDTFGFPVDLTRLMATEQGFTVDMKGFEAELAQQKDRSRKDAAVSASDWVELKEDNVEEFIGYDHLEGTVEITRYRAVKAKDEEMYQLVFNLTPFYAESGGQVGDTGYVEDEDGNQTAIVDTRKENNLIIHFTEELPQNLHGKFKAVVSRQKRMATMANHSATHLLHLALRKVLGEHVEQKGSLVNEEHLRFDFSHFQKVTDEEIAKVEMLVNEMIRSNYPLDEARNVPMEEAKSRGAMALFGEKYGDVVRVIQFGESVELCGGTHVESTGQIGLFKIVHETAVAAGIRRVEAITGEKSLGYINQQLGILEEIKATVKNPKDPIKAVNDLLKQNAELNKTIESLNRKQAGALKDDLLAAAQDVDGVKFIAKKIDLADANAIKTLAFQLKGEAGVFAVLGAEVNGKANLTVAISDDLVKSKDLHAGNIIRELAKEIKGGGGGQPFFATAGGADVNGIAEALKKSEAFIQ